MSYANFLSNTIKNSGYSLRSIASLCEKKYNVKITASYLSKLQQVENKNPASEKVNIAIAKVCGINPDDLIFEADLERAPESVKKIIDEMVLFLKNFFANILDRLLSSTSDSKEIEQIESEINKYQNMGTRELLLAMEEYSNLSSTENPLETSFDLNDDNIEDLIMKLSINIPMEDNSMFPIIKQGAKIELVNLDEYSNGDIVSVELKDGKNIIRTYVDSGKNVILIPANQDFETLTIPKKDIKIKGKVKSYNLDL